jgi:hypothetical protein
MLTQRRMTCIIVMAAMVSVACLSTLWAQDALLGWKSEDRGTHAILLKSVEESGITTIFSFKNVSEKPILAFVVSFAGAPEGSFQSHGCFGAESSCFAPATIFPITFMSRDLSTIADRTILIKAILFEDGTSKGSDREVEYINSFNLGMMFEAERIKNIFVSSTDSNMGNKQPHASADERYVSDESLKVLAAAIGTPPQSPQEAFDSLEHVSLPGVSLDNVRTAGSVVHHAFFSGVSSIRQRALGEVDRLRRMPITSNDAKVLPRYAHFAQLQRKYEEMSSKDRAFCERLLQRGIHQ